MTIADVIDWDDPPESFDRIAADLRAMRSAAGDPSFAEIARRVGALRAKRGVPEREQRVAKSTLYDSFRDGRRRMDVRVVMEIALALGLPEGAKSSWAARVCAARAAADGSSVVSVSGAVPEPVHSYVDREAELEQTESALQSGNRPVWVTAMPGAGKTQLALRVAQRLANEGVGAIFIDLRGHRAGVTPVAPTAARRAILHSLGIEEGVSEGDLAQTSRLIQGLREAGRLLILDDATGPEQVRGIVGEQPRGPVIVTSRVAPGETDIWKKVTLQGLNAEEASQLLAALLPVENERAIADDVTNASRLVDVCEGLPLAISLIGSRLLTHPDWTLADHVDLMRKRVAGGRLDGALQAELDISYADLPEAPARLLRACADLPIVEINLDVIAALLEIDEPAAREIADALVDRNLAIRRAEGRITLHSLVRAYALERAEETDTPWARQEAFARVSAYLAEQIWSAYAVIAAGQGDEPRTTNFEYPQSARSAEAAGAWLQDHLQEALSVAHEAPGRGYHDMLFRISEGLSWWMNLTGRQPAALKLHEAAADHAFETGDTNALAMASLDAGQLHVMGERPDAALEHFSRVRQLMDGADRMADPGLLGLLRNMEATILIRQGRLEEAIEGLQWAVALHRERGEGIRLLGALTNLGVALHTAGRFDEETGVLEEGLQLAVTTGNDLHRSFLLVNSADLAIELGDLDGAARHARSALELAETMDMVFLVVCAQATLAEIARRGSDFDEADRLLTDALDKSETLGQDLTTAEVLILVANLEHDRGRIPAALTALERAKALFSENGDHYLRGRYWRLRSNVADTGQERQELRSRAIEAFERAGAHHRAAEIAAEDREEVPLS
ncbi:MAG TPA: hypothetical protein H9830_02015 [Candidatus Agrococcus pullicola]|uniref:AAA+ ATPase domain-containing protein n=1 Tax=Candidatus Agrococcus pullicola TaxID=2838429 RepID=A0A9D1YTG4_9MICO|nr:hypothetical protein [Candidatus Agrococcus pullicola]